MRKLITVALLCTVSLFVFTAGSCDGKQSGESQRQAAVDQRNENQKRAEDLIPTEEHLSQNFPARQALADYTDWQDKKDIVWYVYIQSDFGNTIGYYTAKTAPVSVCAFLSSTEAIREDEWGNTVMTAPSLDGLYYGGAGAADACSSWFIIDAETNAPIISDHRKTASPFPVKLDESQPKKFESEAPGVVDPNDYE